MDQLSTWLIAFVSEQNNPLGLAALALSALIEYVFPPFPGDTVTLFGAVLITHNDWSFTAVFTAVMLGNASGSMIAFYAGKRWQRRRDEKAEQGRRQRAALNRLVAGFHRHGAVYLVVNRFVPGFRALFFVAAGMVDMPARTVLLYSVVSAALWNLALVVAGAYLGTNLDQLTHLVHQYTTAAWIALVGFIVALAVRALWRRRRRG